jgi:hypothetical protein
VDIANNSPEREADILGAAVEGLRQALPARWTVTTELQPAPRARFLDAIVAVTAPNQQTVELAVEVKRLYVTRDVPFELERLRDRLAADPSLQPTLVARYLAPTTRERITGAGANYLDATGNIWIAAEDPPLLVQLAGADRDPWRGPGRPRGTLKGAPSARVVRALIDLTPPYSVPELVESSGASTGATYRVVKFLEEEGLLERTERGPIERTDWRQILERWSADYGFSQANSTRSMLSPRGIDDTLRRLRSLDEDEYVITGSVAAQLDAPYAPPRLLSLYLRDPEVATQKLDLRPVDRGANVRIAANDDDFPFARRRSVDGLSYAAASQVAVDLLSGPGRSPAEAEELLNWMERSEDVWRR